MNTIMFDIDGVLADFTKGFTQMAHHMFDTPVIPTVTHEQWNFRRFMTDDQQTRVWARIRQTGNWWQSLDPLVSLETFDRIQRLALDHEVYFVTARAPDRAPSVGTETVLWLNRHGVHTARVIANKQKGEIARVLKATHSIEDNWNNAWCIHWMADNPQCKSYLINRQYNMDCRGQTDDKLIRVDTVEQFLDEVEEN